MIKTEKISINEKEFIKTFSSKKVYIQDENGILYPVAYDSIDYPKSYIESNISIKK